MTPRLTAILIFALAFVQPALASDWYQLDSDNHRCNAVDFNPLQFEEYARTDNILVDSELFQNGSYVYGARIGIRVAGKLGDVYLFSANLSCQYVLNYVFGGKEQTR